MPPQPRRMNVAEWQFMDELHPVYERDPHVDTRWIAPLPGMTATAYTPQTPPGRDMQYPQRERLLMTMDRHPSVDIHQTAEGNTVQTVRLYSARYAPLIDLEGIRKLAQDWLRGLQRLSHGPHSLADLRRMGHPYGFGSTGVPSWGRLRDPRVIPKMQGQYRRGARGFVGNRAVINEQSGLLARSWRYSVLPWAGGVTISFWNEAKSKTGFPYPWALAHGSIKMQAHGPWVAVADEMLPEIHSAWRQGAAQAARQQRAMRAQFEDDALAQQQDEYEAGGWQ